MTEGSGKSSRRHVRITSLGPAVVHKLLGVAFAGDISNVLRSTSLDCGKRSGVHLHDHTLVDLPDLVPFEKSGGCLHLLSLATNLVQHVPALAARSNKQYIHCLWFVRQPHGCTFGAFGDLTKPGARAIVAAGWASWLADTVWPAQLGLRGASGRWREARAA